MTKRSSQMSEVRDQWSAEGFEAQRALYLTSDLRTQTSAERGPESVQGFTLLELLIVVGIIGLLLVLIVPAFTSMKSGSDFTNVVYGIQGVLESARIYAKANRTYVFVGFAEVDSSVDSSVSPQVTTGSAPYGRVAVAVVASKDGTRQFVWAASGPGGDWTADYSTHGVVTPTPPQSQDAGNHAVVQLGATDGAVRVYRP
jgi:prepilin-type N-terminal cleavage/methylation domain-containing protein